MGTKPRVRLAEQGSNLGILVIPLSGIIDGSLSPQGLGKALKPHLCLWVIPGTYTVWASLLVCVLCH